MLYVETGFCIIVLKLIKERKLDIDRPGRAIGFEVYYSLVWGINSTAKGDIFYHSGANRSGFRCYSQFDFEEGSGLVIMTNSLNGTQLWSKLVSEIVDL
jgi:hypothetical protein